MFDIKNIVNEEIQNIFEVRHVSFQDMFKDIPLKDDETIVLYHGFRKFADALYMAKHGLSGRERVSRDFSYENGNNPNGLFVSVDFNVVKKDFANSGVIVEFASRVYNLEAPVWAGGGSYFVQGDYAEEFKDNDERQQQVLANRKQEKENQHSAISQSDRPELAQTIYQNREQQALFVGDINPNMIKAFWVNDELHKNNRFGGQWKRISRQDFIKNYYNDKELKVNVSTAKGWEKQFPEKYHSLNNKVFLPAEDFNVNKLKKFLDDKGYNYDNFIEYYVKNWDDYMMHEYFHPRQIEQIKKYYGVENN